MAFVDVTNNPSVSSTRADVCANCNVSAGATLGAGDGAVVKLKKCMACCLIKYCGVDCQKAHRKQHRKACNERAAELAQGRAAVHSGAGEAGGGILFDLYSANSTTDK